MKFLNNWTIDIEQLPKYSAFKGPMTLTLDSKIFRAFVESETPYLNNEQKEITKTILGSINKKNNSLTINHTQVFDIGRFYCSKSPIVLSRHIKHTLFHSLDWIDLDMIKGHPTILYNIANKNGIKLGFFKYYIEQPDKVLSKIQSHYITEVPSITKDDVKDIFSILIYGGGYKTWLKQMSKNGKEITSTPEHEFISAFKDNCRKLIDLVYNSNDAIVNKVKGNLTDEFEIKNRTMSYFCGIIENEIIHTCYKILLKEKVIMGNDVALEYDGLCFKRPNITEEALDELLETINKNIKTKTGLDVKMAWKPYKEEKIHQDILDIAEKLEDEIDIEKESSNKCQTFDNVSNEFEKTHCKIISKAIFAKSTVDEIIFMSKPHIITAYEHLTYEKVVFKADGEHIEKKNFINDWVRNNENQRCYEDIGCFPPGINCPEKCFNTWIPFPMENVEEYEHKEEELQFFLKHIDILCNNDLSVSDYVKKWVAQMIQYPAVKTICPTFISKEGAGKGNFLKCLGKMLGEKKVIETSSPSRDIWGDFNGRMANTFLVNLNELSKRETIESEGRIKQLITDPKITINNKGISQYDINSYHRFIITTNKEDPIATSQDDRRKLIIRCSDENCGNKEYGKKMFYMLDDVNVIKTIYEYFKNIPDMDKFGSLEMPKTEYQKNLTQLSKSPIEQWLEAFVLQNSSESEVRISSSELFGNFTNWSSKNCSEFKITNIKFAVGLKNLSVVGISKGQHTKKGETKIFDIPVLMKNLGLGCVIDIDDCSNIEKEL